MSKRIKVISCFIRYLFGAKVFTLTFAIGFAGTNDPYATLPDSATNVVPEIKPLDGAVWIEEEGIRAAWMGKGSCNEQVLDYMVESKCNVLILTHNIADFLDLNTARWQGDKLLVDYNKELVEKLTEITQRAAERGIRTIFNATYKLGDMLPTLERLGYEKAYVEGPTRFVPAGPKLDASPFDKTLWKGLIGAHGEHIARLSLEYPIFGILYDTEHYDGGIMYLQGCGFGDDSFAPYLKSRGINKSAAEIPAGTRYPFLKSNGLLYDYWNYLEEGIYHQGRYLAERWRSINPNLFLGIWVLFDNWFSHGFLRGLGGEVPSLGLSHCEYISGAFQTKSMREYFESKNPNLYYMPGFLVGYEPDDFEHHVAKALEASGGRYWMLAPHSLLIDPVYRTALSRAYDRGTKIRMSFDQPAVDLDYRIIHKKNEPVLEVSIVQESGNFREDPLLTLRSVRGAAALCENLPMELTEKGRYRVEIPLVRLLTNNRYQQNGFRSGACYEYHPVPRRIRGEDTDHTKLTDGRAYGFAATTAVWNSDVTHAEVIFDLHRNYHISKVALSQPGKLEDGSGGPTDVALDIGTGENEWIESKPFIADMRFTDDYQAGSATIGIDDSRQGRAWLNWFADDIDQQTRWLRIRLDRKLDKETAEVVKQYGTVPGAPDMTMSLGEVMIWGLFNGEIQASLVDGNNYRLIREGKRYTVSAE
jgi:hypothetical protein